MSEPLTFSWHHGQQGRGHGQVAQARAYFETGVATRRTGDEYVRITVVLATVLLLTALAQRFRIRRVRLGLLAVATVLLAYASFLIVNFPRV